ncbi:T6SS immunity protein Tli4 family protein [Luteimonas lutimaris]|uniref:Tle cognate immunity protein 4 C-terminal domain-containing protein n=1 Tax=Luteimonas lutimaris TaxID=698645 RepID=A0ABP7MQN3_9GAMM
MILSVLGAVLSVSCSTAGTVDARQQATGKAVCVGHHALRLPATADVRISATYSGLGVRDEGKAEWQQVELSLRDQAREAKVLPSPGSERARALYRAAGVDPDVAFADSRLVGFDVQGEQAVIARHAQSSGYSIEVHRMYGGHHFVFEGSHANAGQYPVVRNGVLAAVARFTPLASGEVPDSGGFCTGNGMFALKGRNDVGGDTSLYVTFPEYPGLHFSMSLYGLVARGDEPSFLERVGRGLFELRMSGGKVRTLHRGTRTHAGQKGKLVAISMPLENGGEGRAYKYFWHADGVPQDPFRPEIEAEMMTDTDASSVDGETIEALWQQIMGSLQPRGP